MQAVGVKDEEAKIQAVSTAQQVFDAVRDLREADQIATRDTVADLTGLKMSIVDDRLRYLVDEGRLRRLIRGVYELTEVFPAPRICWAGIMQSGRVKLEIGNDVTLDLTPSEARAISRILGGYAEDARVLESTRAHLFMATELAGKVEALQKQVKALKAEKGDGRQASLLLG